MLTRNEQRGELTLVTCIYEDGDLPSKKSLRCMLGLHNYSKEFGGYGEWVRFPTGTKIEGGDGSAGCYYRFCKRCGKVKMTAIHWV